MPFLRLVVAVSTLAGLDDLPARLEGRGVVTAAWLRDLVAHLLDQGHEVPAGLAVVDDDGHPVTRIQEPGRGYRPAPSTDLAVRGRDGVCRFTSCRIPGRHCDLDHNREWDGDPDGAGPTHPANLATLCRGHHEEKTRRHWRLEQAVTPREELASTGWEATGELTITTRSGRLYTTRPDPLPHPRRENRQSPENQQGPAADEPDDPPPF